MEDLSKTKKEKKHLERLSFIIQFKIEFLLPFTGCRKVLGKMPDIEMDWKKSEQNKGNLKLLQDEYKN